MPIRFFFIQDEIWRCFEDLSDASTVTEDVLLGSHVGVIVVKWANQLEETQKKREENMRECKIKMKKTTTRCGDSRL